MSVHLYVEGGGRSNALRAECRRGFHEFLTKAGLRGNLPRVVACGSRQDAFDRFCTAFGKNPSSAMLLVDSEDAVAGRSAWEHLMRQDRWPKPDGATEEHCHLMIQCMESWFLGDRTAVGAFFGQGFHVASLPAQERAIETVPKGEVYSTIQNATRRCKVKAPYGKGDHSFKLLARIDAQAVILASPAAKGLIDALRAR